MKLNLIKAAIVASGVLVVSEAYADTVAVKNGTIFLLGGPFLAAQMLSGVDPAAACTEQLSTQAINPAAVDIVVSGSRAVVAPGLVAGKADVVDVSACLSGHSAEDHESRVDLRNGTLQMPCLNVDNAYYNVQMEQRGSSKNWEVKFGQPVTDGSCTPLSLLAN